jgi:broad specificity phosphatase PhoE
VEDPDAFSGRSVRRLLLVRSAPTRATRTFAFPADEPLDARGRAAASALGAALPSTVAVLSSPARRCRQTAAAAGLGTATLVAALAAWDLGSWTGRTLQELAAAEPEAVGAWRTDPTARPHGGEALSAFAARVAGWLDDQAVLDGGAVAITHGGVVKAAVVHALRAPLEAFWRIDVGPLGVTELHAHDGRWTLTRSNGPLAMTPATAVAS